MKGVAAKGEAGYGSIAARQLLRFVLLLPVIALAAEAPAERIVSFDISRQRADKALIEFAEQADVTFIFPADEARKVTANAVHGDLAPREALTRLLEGTGLQPRFQPDGALAVDAQDTSTDEGGTVKKRGLLASIMAVLAANSAAAADEERGAAAGESRTSALNEIIVTGSRIQRNVDDLPAPVVVANEEFLRRNAGNDELGYALALLPEIGFAGTAATAQSEGATPGTRGDATGGLSRVDLRRLGTERTLVLVNGRRRVAGNFGTTAVDLNTVIPAMIDRVEIITGGASAIYGSDAIAGVVNIITRQDFEGLTFAANAGAPLDGGYGESYGASVMAGGGFADGRGHITLGAAYSERSIVYPDDVGLPDYGLIINPANTGPSDGIPDRILTPGSQSEIVNGAGVFGTRNDTGTLGRFTFGDDGSLQPLPTRIGQVDANFGVFATECGTYCFHLQDYATFVPDQDRTSFAAGLQYELSPGAELYADLSYLKGYSIGNGQPNISLGTGLPINVAQNAFLNPSIRAALLAQGRTTVALTKAWMDVGARFSAVERQSLSTLVGIRGELENAANLSYDVYFSRGETDGQFIGYNRMITANLTAALDAVVDPSSGQIRCRMDVPALQPAGYVRPAIVGGPCVALNPFGGMASSEEARAFVRATTISNATVTQTVGGGQLAGDLSGLFTFPGGGPLKYALGMEYREERSKNLNDGLMLGGQTLVATVVKNSREKYDVTEWFVELNAPLLADRPGARLLSIDAAVRAADYSHAGRTTAWKSGLVWEPIADLRFRGTIGKAVRAPNMVEAFRPLETQAIGLGADPCSQENIQANVNREPNCRALGRPDGWVNPTGGAAVPVSVSGNADLRPESSDSWTVGLTYSPAAVPGLTLGLDWFDIDIEDAIRFVSLPLIANNCVDSPGGPNPDFCNLITRNSNPADPLFFRIETGRVTYVNASRLKTSGLDLKASYQRPLGPGILQLSVVGSYLKELKDYPFQSQPETFTELSGYLNNPEFAGIISATYATGPWTFGWQTRALSSTLLISTAPGASLELADRKKSGDMLYHDISVSYDLTTPSSGDAQIYMGVRNVLDEQLPPMTIQTAQLTGGIFEFVGASAYVGVKWGF